MIATFIIAFREFLEVFLIIGVFFGLSKKLQLKREKEIAIAAGLGIALSLLLPIMVFMTGDTARLIITEKNAEILEGYLMIFSGFFLAYVIFSLHKFFVLRRSGALIKAHQKMEQNIFDLSLFATIVFFVVREGFEIALFTATTSLFSRFTENLAGLTLGFLASGLIGLLAYSTYIKFSIGRIYKWTEYLIVLLGAAFVKNGVTEITEHYFSLNLSKIGSINLFFLPNESTLFGHMLRSIVGLEQSFSLVKGAIMVGYISVIYLFLIKRPKSRIIS